MMSSFFTSTGKNVAETPFVVLGVAFVLFLAGIFVVGFHGNFPLNDDWSYAAAVRSLVIGHDWRPSGWTSATLLTQSLWAAPFCAVGGCSHDMLRLSTLCAAALVMSLAFLLFRRLGAGAWYCGVGMLITMFNPLSFALQFTFMTEMVFVMFLLASLLALVKFIETDHFFYIVAAACLAVAATLCRQLALCVPLAFGIIYMLYRGQRGIVARAAAAWLPLVLCIIAFELFNHWMNTTGRTPAQYGQKTGLIVSALAKPGYLIQRVVWNSTEFLLYLGLMTAPLSIGRTALRFTALPGRARLLPIAVAALFGCMFIAVMVTRKLVMPIGGNILEPQGIGPVMLYGVSPTVPIPLPMILRLVMTAIGLFGAVRLIYFAAAFVAGAPTAFRHSRQDREILTALFLLLAIVIYFVPIASITFYDRYVMPMIPVACAFLLATTVAREKAPIWPLLETAICVFLVCYAVLGVHDWMNWNRARWQAIADLEKFNHATAHDIDGGLEFNGSELYDPSYVPKPGFSVWWIDKDTYQITPGVIPGETVLRSYAYHNFLPPEKKYIYVMEKQ